MQSFQEQDLFCQECGAANTPGTQICVACQHPLLSCDESTPIPVKPALPVLSEVTPGVIVASEASVLLQGRYRLLKVIGQGGFGAVYQARDRQHHNRLVAVKKIDLSNLSSHEIIEVTDTFNREVTLLSQLNHRGLPRLYENFTEGSSWYLVMEYIHGRTLEDLLKRSRRGYFALRKAARIVLEVADVLWYLHRRRPPIIFRDVKPANIMLTRTGRVYLIDFGIARRFSPGKKRDTGPLGSPGYAAPEQYGKAQTDVRTDIYGLGATFQTLLTGRDPLELSTGEAPRNPRPLSVPLQDLLASTMEADPAKRPAQMLDFEERLSRLLLRRYSQWLDFGRGLLLGLPFALWGGLTVLLTVLSSNSQSNLPYYSSLQCALLVFNSLFPLSISAMVIWQVFNIIFKRKPWFALGLLLVLVLTILLVTVLHFAFVAAKIPLVSG